jgi:hypothetical protein
MEPMAFSGTGQIVLSPVGLFDDIFSPVYSSMFSEWNPQEKQ